MNIIQYLKTKSFNVFLRLVPVKKNKIIFNNFCGKGYGDNPKYIADEILKREKKYDLVWMVNDINEPMPKGIRVVLANSRRGRYELATSKIIVCDVKHALVFKKKKSQYYIQTWHGSFGLKYIEKDAIEKLSAGYLNKTIADSKNIDLLLSSSNWQTEEYKRAFWYDGEILEKGFPRNDLFFNITTTRIERIKEVLKIPLNKKICLYGPTFRDSLTTEVYNIDLLSVKQELEKRTQEEWIILIRLHPNIKNYSKFYKEHDFIDVTSYPDGQEILAISDVLITDYSSNMIDFILMDRPVFLYSPDIEEYKKERGLKPLYFQLPFPLCHDNKELIKAIKCFKNSDYLKELSSFRNQYHSFDNGRASEFIVNLIFEKMN